MSFNLVRFKDGTFKMFSPQQATDMFLVQQGLIPATERQQAFVATIERVMLNWHTAPQEYRDRYPRTLPGQESKPLQYKEAE